MLQCGPQSWLGAKFYNSSKFIKKTFRVILEQKWILVRANSLGHTVKKIGIEHHIFNPCNLLWSASIKTFSNEIRPEVWTHILIDLPARMTSCCIEERRKNWLLMRRVQTSCARSQSRLSCNAWKPFCSQSRCQSYHRICIEPAKKIGHQVYRKFSWSIIRKLPKLPKLRNLCIIKNEKRFLVNKLFKNIYKLVNDIHLCNIRFDLTFRCGTVVWQHNFIANIVLLRNIFKPNKWMINEAPPASKAFLRGTGVYSVSIFFAR